MSFGTEVSFGRICRLESERSILTGLRQRNFSETLLHLREETRGKVGRSCTGTGYCYANPEAVSRVKIFRDSFKEYKEVNNA